jgi:hypothetical protein
MFSWCSRLCLITTLSAAAALAPHVPAMAQSDSTITLAGVDTETASKAVEVSSLSSEDRLPIPFAGSYVLSLALGADTADFLLRIGEQGVERSIAMPAQRKRRLPEPAAVRALIVPASLSTDSSIVPAAELTGSIAASPEDTTAFGHGRWWVTILAGADTDAATPAGRLSRLLLKVRAEREGLALRCEADAKGENRLAKRRNEPPPCDQASGLPISNATWDGILFLGADGNARVEQRTQTDRGELTLWGSRIAR